MEWTWRIALFKRHFRQLRFDDDLGFSTKAAAEIATNLSVGLLGPIYAQMDPMRLGEVERLLRISAEYGERITRNRSANNVKDGGLERLLAKYPSHGFVIDKTEGRDIFRKIDDPTDAQQDFVDFWNDYAQRYIYGDNAFTGYFCNEPTPPSPSTPEGQANEQPQDGHHGAPAEDPGGQ